MHRSIGWVIVNAATDALPFREHGLCAVHEEQRTADQECGKRGRVAEVFIDSGESTVRDLTADERFRDGSCWIESVVEAGMRWQLHYRSTSGWIESRGQFPDGAWSRWCETKLALADLDAPGSLVPAEVRK